MIITKQNNKLESILIFITTFFLIYGPKLKINIPIISDTMLIPIIVGIVYLLLRLLRLKSIPINKNFIELFIILFILTIYTFIIVWINGFRDTYILLRNARSLLSFIGVINISMIYFIQYKEKALIKVIENIFLSAAIHAMIMWGMISIDSFRSIIHKIVDVKLNGREILNTVRVSGLMTEGGDGTSLIQGMMVLLGPIVIANKTGNKKILYFILFILIWTSSFLSARTGFYLSTLMLLLTFILNININRIISFKIKKDVVKIFVTISIIVAIVPLLISQETKENLFTYYDSPIYRLMEPIRTFIDTGKISTRSSSKIMNDMIILPNEGYKFIFGSSNMGRSNRMEYIPSDIGYIRILFAIGIIGSVILYGWVGVLVIMVIKNNTIDEKYKKLFKLLVIYTMIGHFKMVFALSRSNFNLMILIFGSMELNKYVKIKN